MFRLVRSTVVAVSALAVTSCATTMNVSSHVQRTLDVAHYRTCDWGPADALPTGDPRLDKDPFFQDHIQGAVEKQLAAKGFEQSASGTPDLLLHYHASVTQRVDVGGADRQYGYCDARDCQPYVYEAGTLVIDFVDARTNRLVWRGWAEDTVDGVIDNQEWLEQRVNDAVARILERLPRRL